jgi:hypothetical protein
LYEMDFEEIVEKEGESKGGGERVVVDWNL